MRSSAGSPQPAIRLRGGPQARTFMYAIIDIGGKQFKVEKDQKLYVPRLQAEIGDTVTFDRALARLRRSAPRRRPKLLLKRLPKVAPPYI